MKPVRIADVAQSLGIRTDLNDLPASPLASPRCGVCGCRKGGGRGGSDHFLTCTSVEFQTFRQQRCSDPLGQSVTEFLFPA